MRYTIYKHTSPDNKIYIGRTTLPVDQRWQNGRGYKFNKVFYNDIIKYGWDNFNHEILEYTDDKLREQYWISFYDSTNPNKGYNVFKNNSGYRPVNKAKGTKNKGGYQPVDKVKGRLIYCEELDKTYRTLKDAGKDANVDQSSIGKVCRGERKTAGGFHWKYI